RGGGLPRRHASLHSDARCPRHRLADADDVLARHLRLRPAAAGRIHADVSGQPLTGVEARATADDRRLRRLLVAVAAVALALVTAVAAAVLTGDAVGGVTVGVESVAGRAQS